MRRSPILRILCAACLLATAASCRRNGGVGVEGAAQPMPGDALAWQVDRVQVTRHLATSTLESRDAPDGNAFVVLDVRVRNPDRQPQVVSEGRLVAVEGTREQTFATPVSMLADEFLTLQVLAPAADAHGKIAFEVPRDLAGALYWTPGNSRQRIQLRVAPGPATPAVAVTSGNAEAPAVAPTRSKAAARATSTATVEGERRIAEPAAARAAPAKPRVVASAEPAAHARAPKAAPAGVRPIVIPAAQEQERRARCDALLTRNAQADEALRPFYLLNCPDYPLPPAWQTSVPGQRAQTLATATPSPSPRPATQGCGADASPAARLVCGDAFVAGLDRRLAQSLAHALQVVGDPAALQREQDDWRTRVRDACGTVRCLELAYGRRNAHLEAVGQVGP